MTCHRPSGGTSWRESAASAPGQLPEPIEGDRVNKRVGVSMHEMPHGILPPKHERRSQRPVLCRIPTNLAVLTLDDDEDSEVA